ncbi:hypothetical protein E2542_SST26270 [Spatholobus suberectus]|nr:hypothetical protein E2542_SST26270 [Spatholobus suberectus]
MWGERRERKGEAEATRTGTWCQGSAAAGDFRCVGGGGFAFAQTAMQKGIFASFERLREKKLAICIHAWLVVAIGGLHEGWFRQDIRTHEKEQGGRIRSSLWRHGELAAQW